ncbi:MAG: metalloregulator ArsR/SmtB family transcription factor [Planctomycetia bacterium]|nr:metalloregulator ArsR/SmtB family transcription factor [Planctomycetia bacterium]
MQSERLPVEFLTRMAETLRILGHPQRLQILEYLDLHGESAVQEIVNGIMAQQGAVSQHLTKMRMAGVLVCRRSGKQIRYCLAEENAVTILNCMRKKFAAIATNHSPEPTGSDS